MAVLVCMRDQTVEVLASIFERITLFDKSLALVIDVAIGRDGCQAFEGLTTRDRLLAICVPRGGYTVHFLTLVMEVRLQALENISALVDDRSILRLRTVEAHQLATLGLVVGAAEGIVHTGGSVEEWTKCLRNLTVDRVVVGMTASEESVLRATHGGDAVWCLPPRLAAEVYVDVDVDLGADGWCVVRDDEKEIDRPLRPRRRRQCPLKRGEEQIVVDQVVRRCQQEKPQSRASKNC